MRGAFCFRAVFSLVGTLLWPLGVGVEEMRKEERAA